MNNQVYATTPTRTLPAMEWSATLCDGTDYETAEEACAALGDGWRLPTIHELISLVDYGRPLMAIDTDVFGDAVQNWYWTSTPCADVLDDGDSAWAVYFGTGDSKVVHRERCSASVRAVREVTP